MTVPLRVKKRTDGDTIIMQPLRPFVLLATVGALLLGAAPVRAAPVLVTATLTPQAIGTGNPFGFTSLPAGPFTATLTFSGPLAANLAISTVADLTGAGLTGFALTIGTVSFDKDDLTLARLTTNATGIATELRLAGSVSPGLRPYFALDVPAVFSNVQWYAGEATCNLANVPQVVGGPCVVGTPGSASLSQMTMDPTPVPAPGGLAVFGLALLGLGAVARRRT
jgi:hypothetical protein